MGESWDMSASSEPIRVGSSGWYGPRRTCPTSVLALVLGILGIAACPFVGIGGFLAARKARKEIDADPRRWTGRGMATAGWILGIISMVYCALIVLALILAYWLQFSR
jgi:hypothetical protein